METKSEKRIRRHKRIRSTISGTASRPRLAVFKSNRYIYAQIIDDTVGKTLASIDSKKIKGENLIQKAEKAGEEIAKSAKEKNIEAVVFDRGGFLFTGVVKALAEGARKGGLKF